MIKTGTSSIIATALITFSPVTSAAYFDFQAWIATYGEMGFDNSAPFSLSDSGLTLTATAYENPGMISSHVYMDDTYNGIIGGMGVCSVLTSGDQCNPSSDDNVSIDGGLGEVLSWNFNQGVNSLTLEFGNNDHFDFTNSDIEYSLDGVNWLTATTDVNASLTIATIGGGSSIDFRAADEGFENHFYIRNADITVVPVPAAAWLFGSGLIALSGFLRRR